MGGAVEVSKRQSLLLPRSADSDVVASELEGILGDEPVPWVRRMRAGTVVEMRKLVRLAVPAALVYMTKNLMFMSTQIFSGRLGTLSLAATSPGFNGIQMFAYGVMIGMGSAVQTLCGQAYGAQKFNMLGLYMQRSVILLMATAIPLAVIYIYSFSILDIIGESREIARATSIFVYGLIPQIFAYTASFPIENFLQAQSIMAPSAYINAFTLAVHIILTYLAIYRLGLGLLGASLVLSASSWIVVIAQLVYIFTSNQCQLTWDGFSMKAFSGLPQLFKLSVASGVMLCLDAWYWQVIVLITGLLKDPELSLASLSVGLSISTWMLMISFGFNASASVRVSNELGAGNAKSAAFSVVVGTMLSLVLSVIVSVAILLCWRYPDADRNPDVGYLQDKLAK